MKGSTMETGKMDPSDGLLRTAQLITFALATGVILFLVIVTVFLGARVQAFEEGAMISFAMAAIAVVAIFARLFVPGLVVNSSCQRIATGTFVINPGQSNTVLPDTDEGKLLQVFLIKTIIGAAILEGGAFGNLVAFMLEGQIYSIVLAIICLLGVVVAFPTRSGLSEWLESRQRRLSEFRSMKS